MPALAGRELILGVTGSIAAYKAADLTSHLAKSGCSVHLVMTTDAQRFITPLPLKTLSRHPVVTDLYDEEEGWRPTHIRLADEADLLLIAPATANQSRISWNNLIALLISPCIWGRAKKLFQAFMASRHWPTMAPYKAARRLTRNAASPGNAASIAAAAGIKTSTAPMTSKAPPSS